MTYNSMLKVYVDHITDGQLQWATMADPFDTIVIGQGDEARHYPRFSGKEKFRQGLVDKFPDEIVAIDKWMKYIESSENTDLGQVMTKLLPMWLNKFLSSTGLFNLFTNYYKYSQRSVKEMAEELTTNKDLQAVMSYCHGDYGTLPGDASFALHCGLMFHFLKGASYPVGGASEIAFHIIPSIEKAGGKVLVRAPVSQVLLDGEGGAYGVRVHKSSGDVDIHAPIIISDAGFFNTFQSLLPPQIMDKSVYKPLVDKGNIKHGVSCMSLFVGLKGSKKELGIEGRNWWLFPDNDLDKQSRDFLSLSGDEIENQDIPLLFISFPSAKDPTWEERYPGKSTCAVITMANWEWFQEWEAERVMKRGEVYEKRKNALADALWKRTLKMFPNLEDKVEYFDIGSPVTNKYYIGSPKGEIYGLDHQLSRFDADTISALRSKTLVPNLYLTGQDVFCCGFAGALIGALLCAGTVLNRNLFIDVTMLQYKISRKKKGK
uniref:All-trans-retinol 13,14-reductase-like n=1 Tax=Saccoglossus kowalevskii TaxID=10224 RepID=A0ABM0MHX1_SACKO|nr:PREDICTED: putative all-trans-retinol 13,14-reductase-like [Saccoglossus kowalevskii]